jgi:hypothetical protein
MRKASAAAIGVLFLAMVSFLYAHDWPHHADSQPLSKRIIPPRGFKRVPFSNGSFSAWLRELPLLDGHPPVHLYDGRLKRNQKAHCAVVDLDVDPQDLQQCADAVMRVRAEYLWQAGRKDEIGFLLANGDRLDWPEWRKGAHLKSYLGVRFRAQTGPDDSYVNFRKYLLSVFRWANTVSLSRQLAVVRDKKHIESGDVFIKGGAPGHAVLVVDVAENARGEKVFLLAQSYMPAQEFQVLHSPDPTLDPWYKVTGEGTLETPEWDFTWDQLKRFPKP